MTLLPRFMIALVVLNLVFLLSELILNIFGQILPELGF